MPTVASDLLTKRERALAEHYRRAYPWLDQVEPNGRQVPVREGWPTQLARNAPADSDRGVSLSESPGRIVPLVSVTWSHLLHGSQRQGPTTALAIHLTRSFVRLPLRWIAHGQA